MRKLFAFTGTIVVALVAPATVGAAAKVYVGEFETSGEVQFKVKKTDHGKKIKEFDWFEFPLNCQGTPKTSTNGLSFAPKVRNNRFEAVATAIGDGLDAKLKVTGTLKGSGKAKGTLEIDGDKVPVNEAPSPDKCSSPRTSWTASVVNRAARSSAPTHSPWVTPR
jgi:hypothetical protein